MLSWTPEDDGALERQYRTLGPKWTQIGRVPDKQPNAVKNRWRRPQQIRVDQLLRDKQPDPLPPIGPILLGADDLDTSALDDLINAIR